MYTLVNPSFTILASFLKSNIADIVCYMTKLLVILQVDSALLSLVNHLFIYNFTNTSVECIGGIAKIVNNYKQRIDW